MSELFGSTGEGTGGAESSADDIRKIAGEAANNAESVSTKPKRGRPPGKKNSVPAGGQTRPEPRKPVVTLDLELIKRTVNSALQGLDKICERKLRVACRAIGLN